MVKGVVGYRFRPTDEELINHYLKNKILGKTWLVEDGISEINICSYKPTSLPSLSKLKYEDPVWYFFAPREYKSGKKKLTKRTTGSGFWKPTGEDRIIMDKRGNRQIGIKKTLVYYEDLCYLQSNVYIRLKTKTNTHMVITRVSPVNLWSLIRILSAPCTQRLSLSSHVKKITMVCLWMI